VTSRIYVNSGPLAWRGVALTDAGGKGGSEGLGETGENDAKCHLAYLNNLLH